MTAKELRDRAEEMRILSGHMQTDICREQLLTLAYQYDAMAADRQEIHDDYEAVQRRSRVSRWVEQ